MTWRIERFSPTCDRTSFDCGKPPLNDFLTRYASQYEKKNLARTFLMTAQGDNKVVGYYSLASSAVPFESLPPELSKRLARHPIPAVLLARLAVDQSVQGQGLGQYLLRDAFSRCIALSEQVGVFAVTVDAIDDEAVSFYERFGFIRFTAQPDKLFIPVSVIRQSGSG